jgi:hypothetical protein
MGLKTDGARQFGRIGDKGHSARQGSGLVGCLALMRAGAATGDFSQKRVDIGGRYISIARTITAAIRIASERLRAGIARTISWRPTRGRNANETLERK